MQFLRTPKDIWESLSKEFQFTLDACASDKNFLCSKYYTKETDCLKQDWTGEVVYLHPLFDMHIGKFVEKAFNSKCTTVMLLPASTHTRYFHSFIWDMENNKPRNNVEVRFLEKPNKGFNFGNDDGTIAEIPKGKLGYIKPLMIVIFRKLNNGNNGIPPKLGYPA
jgi:phage N-6-adenine-methyltransferase